MSTKSVTTITKEATLNSVQNRIAELQQGGFKLPSNYSPENALQSAWLILQDVQTRDKRPVLEACSKQSIALSLFKMVQLGLNPAKNQCYFVPYGNDLICMTSYFGQVLIANRSGLKDVKANVILEGDEFNYKIESDGRKVVSEHNQPFKNLGNDIIGAYCVFTLPDGSQDTDIMTIDEIKKSWSQGATNGNSPAHKKFDGEMAKRTVINRAIKMFVNSSDDSVLMDDDQPTIQQMNDKALELEIEENANKKESIGFDDDEVDEIDHEEVKQKEVVAEQMPAGFEDDNDGPGF